jgi:hypothetical protein
VLYGAARSDEMRRLTRARAAIASARSIFRMASTERDLTKTINAAIF